MKMKHKLANVNESKSKLDLCLKEGRLEEAEGHILNLLKMYPEEPDLLYHLGNIYRKQDKINEAIKRLSKSIALNNEHGYALNCMGHCYLKIGDTDKSLEYLKRCYDVSKNTSVELFRDSCFNLTVLSQRVNNLKELKFYALQIPQVTDDVNILQTTFNIIATSLDKEAILSFINLISDDEQKSDILYNCVTALKEKKSLNNALLALRDLEHRLKHIYNYWAAVSHIDDLFLDNDSLRKNSEEMLKIEPRSSVAYFYLSSVLIREHKFIEALSCADIGLSINNSDSNLCYAKAFSAHKLNYTVMAAFYYRKALSLGLENNMLKISLADLYRENMRRDLELQELNTYIDPLIETFKKDGKVDLIFELHMPVLSKYLISGGYNFEINNTSIVRKILKSTFELYKDTKNIPHEFGGVGFLSLQMTINDVELYNKILRLNTKYNKQLLPRERHKVSYKDKLKVGYISSDFRKHSVGIIMSSIFRGHTDRVDLHLYSNALATDSVTSEIMETTKNFYNIAEMTDLEAANLIEEHNIDILVDLMGYTAHSRAKILAYNPAPVQIHMMGQTSSLCSDNINYFLASKHFVSEGKWEDYFHENVVLMPNMHMAVDKFYEPESYPSKKELGLPEDKFILYSFATEYRMDKEYFDLVAAILKSNETAVFWVKCPDKEFEDKIYNYFEEKSIDRERIFFDNNSYLTEKWQHKNADLMLDSLRITGGTSIFLSLQVGLPVVAFEGEAPWERHSSSILRDCGLNDLVVSNIDEYVDKVSKLISDKKYYENVRNKIKAAGKATSMFDALSFTKELENAYFDVWKHYVSKAKNKVIKVK